MKSPNLAYLEMIANALDTFTRVKSTLDKSKEITYVKIDAKWCNNVAEELRKIILEEEMGNGKEE